MEDFYGEYAVILNSALKTSILLLEFFLLGMGGRAQC